jgi:hypothetical protein
MTTSAPRRRVRWSAADDAALDAILALEGAWDEKVGHVTLADLGLDARLRTLSVEATCAAHGNFAREWVGCLGEFLPDEIACDLHGPDGRPCGLASKVRAAEIR